MTLLSFSPRCLVAKNGWLCCGGETGEFAAIQLDRENETVELPPLEPEVRLPLDLDPASADDEIMAMIGRPRAAKRSVAKSHVFGKERVNCITLWFPPTIISAFGGAYQCPVAVLANNDHHVTFVKLGSTEALDELSYPDCVNRAVLSPDGRLLIAVSDDPYLYVHERVEKEPALGHPFRSGDKPEYEWKECRRVHLKSQRKDDRTDHRGSFAACFSNTGQYLAVGTQYGMISIFDTSAFTTQLEDAGEVDALLTYFPSSKPESDSGAVREMSFCPGPFDLLAWSEDRGAVGVADVRTGFVSRQILQLGDEAAYEHFGVSEKSGIDSRPLDLGTIQSEALQQASNTTNAINASLNAATRARLGIDPVHGPLSSAEAEVLVALRDGRQRREQQQQQRERLAQLEWQGQQEWQAVQERREQRDQQIRELREQQNALREYLGPRTPWAARPSARTTMMPDGSRSRERSASVTRVVNDILGNIQTQRDQIRSARETTDSERRRSVAPVPARRTVVPGRGATDSEAPPTGNREGLLSRLMAHPPAMSTRGWDNLDALYSISFDSGSQDVPRTTDADVTRRERATYLGSLATRGTTGATSSMREWDDDLAAFHFRAFGHSREPPKPDETAGLAWSDDGSILYVPSSLPLGSDWFSFLVLTLDSGTSAQKTAYMSSTSTSWRGSSTRVLPCAESRNDGAPKHGLYSW